MRRQRSYDAFGPVQVRKTLDTYGSGKVLNGKILFDNEMKTELNSNQTMDCFKNTWTTGKTIFMSFVVCLCLAQVYTVTAGYLEFSTTVSISVKKLNSLREALPSITICNKNIIRLDAAMKASPDLRGMVKAWKKANYSGLEREKKRAEAIDYGMKFYYRNYLIQNQLEDGPDLNKFVQKLSCSHVPFLGKKATWDCSKIDRITSAQGKGSCVTLFHLAANYGEESGASGQNTLDTFSAQEIVRFKLDFEPEQYTDVAKAPGAEMVIHDRRSIPLMASLSHTLRPGHFYEFFLKRSLVIGLEPPYKTNCKKYFEDNIGKYGTGTLGADLRYPLSRTQCLANCIAEGVSKACRCWPKEIPYWLNTTIDYPGAGVKSHLRLDWCDWSRPKNNESYSKCFSPHSTSCRKQCPKDCLTESFDIQTQAREWPGKERIWLTKGKQREMMEEDAKCCAIVSIKLKSLEETINQHNPRTAFVDLISVVGGMISLFVGISVLSIIHTVISYAVLSSRVGPMY